MRIINTLQHTMTTGQLEELTSLGYTEVVHLKEVDPELFAALANTPGNEKGVKGLACGLLGLVDPSFGHLGVDALLLPLGSPAVMFQFARLVGENTRPPLGPENLPAFIFAHTERVAEDQRQDDGTVKKVAVFKHVRFLKL